MLCRFSVSWCYLTNWLGRLVRVTYGKACQLISLSLSLRLGYCTNSRCSESRCSTYSDSGNHWRLLGVLLMCYYVIKLRI